MGILDFNIGTKTLKSTPKNKRKKIKKKKKDELKKTVKKIKQKSNKLGKRVLLAKIKIK